MKTIYRLLFALAAVFAAASCADDTPVEMGKFELEVECIKLSATSATIKITYPATGSLIRAINSVHATNTNGEYSYSYNGDAYISGENRIQVFSLNNMTPETEYSLWLDCDMSDRFFETEYEYNGFVDYNPEFKFTTKSLQESSPFITHTSTVTKTDCAALINLEVNIESSDNYNSYYYSTSFELGDEYTIEYGTNPAGDDWETIELNINDPNDGLLYRMNDEYSFVSLLAKNLEPGTTYFYRVFAKNTVVTIQNQTSRMDYELTSEAGSFTTLTSAEYAEQILPSLSEHYPFDAQQNGNVLTIISNYYDVNFDTSNPYIVLRYTADGITYKELSAEVISPTEARATLPAGIAAAQYKFEAVANLSMQQYTGYGYVYFPYRNIPIVVRVQNY